MPNMLKMKMKIIQRSLDNRKFRNNEKKFNRKNFLSKDCDSSNESDNTSDDDSDSESDNDGGSKKLLFMAMSSTGAPESNANNSEDEGEVHLKEELVSSLKELGRVRMKCKALKEDVKELVRERQGIEETISKLELQLEVSKRNEDRFAEQLQEREQLMKDYRQK